MILQGDCLYGIIFENLKYRKKIQQSRNMYFFLRTRVYTCNKWINDVDINSLINCKNIKQKESSKKSSKKINIYCINIICH